MKFMTPSRSSSGSTSSLSQSARAAMAKLSGSLRDSMNRSSLSGSKRTRMSRGFSSSKTMDTSQSIAGPSFRSVHWDDAPDEFQPERKAFPGTANFASNHVLVNQERVRAGKAPLDRSRELDTLARQRAEEMAKKKQIFAKNKRINSSTQRENVQKGPTIRFIHQMIMGGMDAEALDVILSDRCEKFGIGCATGEDGMIYMSQIFEEPPKERSFLFQAQRSFMLKKSPRKRRGAFSSRHVRSPFRGTSARNM